jgi:predicted metal-dependent hydrolase
MNDLRAVLEDMGDEDLDVDVDESLLQQQFHQKRKERGDYSPVPPCV